MCIPLEVESAGGPIQDANAMEGEGKGKTMNLQELSNAKDMLRNQDNSCICKIETRK
jgi:hypothetical protein